MGAIRALLEAGAAVNVADRVQWRVGICLGRELNHAVWNGL